MFSLLTKYKLIAIGIATVVALTAAFGFGYKTANNECKANALAEMEALQETIRKLEDFAREKEKEALAAKRERDNNVKEFIKKISDYVDRTECRLTDDGRVSVNNQLERH